MVFFGHAAYIGKVTVHVTDLDAFFHAGNDADICVTNEQGEQCFCVKRNLTLVGVAETV